MNKFITISRHDDDHTHPYHAVLLASGRTLASVRYAHLATIAVWCNRYGATVKSADADIRLELGMYGLRVQPLDQEMVH